MNNSPYPLQTVAAVLYDQQGGLADTMAGFALSMRDRGLRVRGLISASLGMGDGGSRQVLMNIDTGKTFDTAAWCHPLSVFTASDDQNEQASGIMGSIVPSGADLALFHQFTDAEARGRGVASEIRSIVDSGIPFLTTVHRHQYAAWQAFTNRDFVLLPPSLHAMYSWIDTMRNEQMSSSLSCLEKPVPEVAQALQLST